MEKHCVGEGLMEAMLLYDKLESVKNEIDCLQKGFEGEGNFENQKLMLRKVGKKFEEIDNYAKNMGSSVNYPMDCVTLKRMWACLKKTEEEIKQLVSEIEDIPTAAEIYYCAYQAWCTPFD
jgi:hypothetical protein